MHCGGLRKVAKKISEKVWSFAKPGGSKMPNLYFGKVFFQLPCRIIIEPPKQILFVFEVRPSVKLVSAIKDAIFNKKMGVKFLFGKNAKQGGGAEGGLAIDHTFSGFFLQPSLTSFSFVNFRVCSAKTTR